MMYEYVKDANGVVSTNTIRRIDDGATIPCNESNFDYQQYLIHTDGGISLPE